MSESPEQKLLIFDFDGTLADTLDVAVEILSDLADQSGYRKLNKEQIRELSSKEVLTHIGVPLLRLPYFVAKARREMSQHLHSVQLFPEIAAMLQKLKAQGAELAVLTSNSLGNVEAVFKAQQMQGVIDHRFSGSSLFGKDRKLKTIVRQLKADLRTTLYIGDETRDIEACQKAGIEIYPVSWGYHSYELLSRYHPGPIYPKVQALEQALLGHLADKKKP